MPDGKPWKLIQLAGDRRELLLNGWSAPYGRPRQKAIVQSPVQVRQTTIYYPGSSVPTRHVFGLLYQPWELTGRFRDADPTSAGSLQGQQNNPPGFPWGKGYAKAKTLEVRQFVSDAQPISISWGDVLAATGFVELFEPKWEAEFEVEWRMVILIDQDDSTPAENPVQSGRRSPGDAAQQVVSLFQDAMQAAAQKSADQLKLAVSNDDVLKPSVGDSIENAIGSINSGLANFTNAANAIDSFERAAIGDIKRFRGGINQVRTAIQNITDTVSSLKNDLALQGRDARRDITFGGNRVNGEGSLTKALAAMTALDRQAEIAERGKTTSSYIARVGDTWESIATSQYADPTKAQRIRDINGVKYGEQPAPGQSYKLPA